ncbi:MAG: 3-keto-5-aminohexanoate cleavage protein [Actinobacteria bacterium]|jgi:3-keto-5-aminohexanoate cleavage enzyme|nr:3-keto-5-aminohexanoate cleavage protein [Actinomycetota bacterium]
MDPLIITVAAVGAELIRDQQPALPLTPDEIGRDALECERAGASIYHLHVRDASGNPTMDVGAFEAALDAIRSQTELIVQFTSGGAVGDDADARAAPLRLRPEMATLTTGSVNFGEGVFLNPLPLVRRLYARMRALGIVPEFEIFEAGMIANALLVTEEHGVDHHLHFDFVLGVAGALPAWDGVIDFLSARLPPGATWSATGIGRSHLAVTGAAIAKGGHVRTGLEDTRYFAPGVLASSNAQLVARVADLAGQARRGVAGPAEARRVLGLTQVS